MKFSLCHQCIAGLDARWTEKAIFTDDHWANWASGWREFNWQGIFFKNVETIQKSYPWRTNLRPIQEAMEWTEEARPGFTTLWPFYVWFLPAQVKVEVKSAGREKTKYKKTDSPVSPVLSSRKSGTIQYLSKAGYMHVTWQIKSIFLEAIKAKLDRKMTR